MAQTGKEKAEAERLSAAEAELSFIGEPISIEGVPELEKLIAEGKSLISAAKDSEEKKKLQSQFCDQHEKAAVDLAQMIAGEDWSLMDQLDRKEAVQDVLAKGIRAYGRQRADLQHRAPVAYVALKDALRAAEGRAKRRESRRKRDEERFDKHGRGSHARSTSRSCSSRRSSLRADSRSRSRGRDRNKNGGRSKTHKDRAYKDRSHKDRSHKDRSHRDRARDRGGRSRSPSDHGDDKRDGLRDTDSV